MRILNPRGHLLRIWFSDKPSLYKFREEYEETITNVSIIVKDFWLNDEKGYIFVVDLI